MKVCIICDTENDAKSVEHIVSESLGNKHYLMEKSTVCDSCNSRFSRFEGDALSGSILLMERARNGVQTKSGKSVNGKIAGLTIKGNENFEKNKIFLKSDKDDFFKDFDPSTGIGTVVVPSFGKSSIPLSKLMLKMGLESLYKSQPKIFEKYNFDDAKDYLLTKTNNDWPIVTSEYELVKFNHIPKYRDKYELGLMECKLMFAEIDANTLIFKFKYYGIPIEINLLNRNLSWAEKVLENDSKAMLYPKHYHEKVNKKKEKAVKLEE